MDLKRKFLILKFYFDSGLGILGYLKYLIVAVGITFKDTKTVLILGFLSSIFCVFLGWFWAKYKFMEISNDISNQYNPFVTQTLKHLSKNKKFK